MRKKALILLFASFAIVIAGHWVAVSTTCDLAKGGIYCENLEKLTKFYEKNIRGHLFAGFLALGGFLLSLKTFIVVSMKENVYDNKRYKDNWERQLKIDPGLKLYSPLKELSDLLFYAILSVIVTAILQMTLGLYPHWIASLLCLGSAVYAILLLLKSLFLIKKNLDVWFSYLEPAQP